MEYSLDVVPVGVEYECCVVAGMILSFTRLAVVAATSGNCSTVEGLDLLLPASLERQMDV